MGHRPIFHSVLSLCLKMIRFHTYHFRNQKRCIFNEFQDPFRRVLFLVDFPWDAVAYQYIEEVKNCRKFLRRNNIKLVMHCVIIFDMFVNTRVYHSRWQVQSILNTIFYIRHRLIIVVCNNPTDNVNVQYHVNLISDLLTILVNRSSSKRLAKTGM